MTSSKKWVIQSYRRNSTYYDFWLECFLKCGPHLIPIWLKRSKMVSWEGSWKLPAFELLRQSPSPLGGQTPAPFCGIRGQVPKPAHESPQSSLRPSKPDFLKQPESKSVSSREEWLQEKSTQKAGCISSLAVVSFKFTCERDTQN